MKLFNHPFKFDVWMEGYVATGENGKAEFLGSYKAKTFEQACMKACQAHYSSSMNCFKINTDGTPSFWGCRMFDNEEDARKFCG